MSAPSSTTLSMIERLLRFDTTSARSNRALIDDVANYLDGYGIPVTILPEPGGDKANLIAHIGPESAPALVISGHTDVVPADPSQWTVSGPFEPAIEGGRLYARGSADMKSFLGLALAVLAPLQKRRPKHRVILALSFDEEVGCRGAPLMMPTLAEHASRIRGCIIGEPTSWQVAYAHKGKLGARATIRGRGGHSAHPDKGINAIDIAAELVAHLRRRALAEREGGMSDRRFDPPYSTVHTGLIAGGSALNVIPERCDIDFEMRSLPGRETEGLLNELRAFFEDGLPQDLQLAAQQAVLELDRRSHYPGLLETSQDFITWVAELSQASRPPTTLSFGSEAGLFSQLGVPAVVCGPGSIHQAHLPDEYVELEQLVRGEHFFDRVGIAVCNGLPAFEQGES